MKIYRQGDILIRKIDLIPKEAKKIDNRILAHGEATGHTHSLIDGIVFALSGLLFFELAEETMLTHEEHDSILIPAGAYEVIRQKEYTPERIRYVQD